MTRHRKKIILITAVIIAVLVFVLSTSGSDPIKVVLKTVETGTVEASVANTRAGTVMACQRARLSPAIGGQIAALPVKEGDHVVLSFNPMKYCWLVEVLSPMPSYLPVPK